MNGRLVEADCHVGLKPIRSFGFVIDQMTFEADRNLFYHTSVLAGDEQETK